MYTNRKIIKYKKQLKKLLILTGIYLILAAIITFSVIFIINNSIVMHEDDVAIKSQVIPGASTVSIRKYEEIILLTSGNKAINEIDL